jgi:hypothetical protein
MTRCKISGGKSSIRKELGVGLVEWGETAPTSAITCFAVSSSDRGWALRRTRAGTSVRSAARRIRRVRN